MDIKVRRIIVWVLSLLIGTGVALAIVWLGFNTTLDKYGVSGWNNFYFLAIAIAGLFWIWLDYFLGTEMLPK